MLYGMLLAESWTFKKQSICDERMLLAMSLSLLCQQKEHLMYDIRALSSAVIGGNNYGDGKYCDTKGTA